MQITHGCLLAKQSFIWYTYKAPFNSFSDQHRQTDRYCISNKSTLKFNITVSWLAERKSVLTIFERCSLWAKREVKQIVNQLTKRSSELLMSWCFSCDLKLKEKKNKKPPVKLLFYVQKKCSLSKYLKA